MKQPKLGFVAMRVHDCEMDIAVDFFVRLGYNELANTGILRES